MLRLLLDLVRRAGAGGKQTIIRGADTRSHEGGLAHAKRHGRFWRARMARA